MMAEKQRHTMHVPVRTCVICREKAGKRTLTRIVRTEHGILIDLTGKMNGRGAYLCDRVECWERAIKSDILNQALRTKMSDEDRMHLFQAKPKP
ncbi:MAG: YlxR family protein [Anaerolineae bacterium]